MLIDADMEQVQPQTSQTFMPLGEALMHAERCRTQGLLMEAEAVCRQILQAQPNVAEAEHLLGVIAHQNGKLGDAIEHVKRATRLAPHVALFHANLGEMLRLAGRPKLAVKEVRSALAIEPDMPAALSNLGVALYDLKDYEEASRAQRKAIACLFTQYDSTSAAGRFHWIQEISINTMPRLKAYDLFNVAMNNSVTQMATGEVCNA